MCVVVAVVASCGRSPAPSTATAQSTTDTRKGTYELQEKCARDAHEWYKQNWKEGPPIAGLTTDYTNHYNARMGKCFMVLQVTIVEKTADHTNRLMDVLENRDVGVVEWFEGKLPSTCTFNGQPCKSADEWNALVKPYMKD